MPTLIANKKWLDRHHPCWEKDKQFVFIGRGSKLGNDFTHLPLSQTKARYSVRTRQEAINCFDAVLQSRLRHEEPGLRQLLLSCEGKTLVCYCHPLPCHASVIIRLIEEIKAGMWPE